MVRVRRCRSAACEGEKMWICRCITTAAFLRRTLRRRSREKYPPSLPRFPFLFPFGGWWCAHPPAIFPPLVSPAQPTTGSKQIRRYRSHSLHTRDMAGRLQIATAADGSAGAQPRTDSSTVERSGHMMPASRSIASVFLCSGISKAWKRDWPLMILIFEEGGIDLLCGTSWADIGPYMDWSV